MSLDTQNFESEFGFKVPDSIIKLLSDDALIAQMPTRIRFENHSFVLELQYLLDITKVENYDVEKGRFKFAVTTDGLDLLVDLHSPGLDVLQDEFGEVDCLGVSINELLEAVKEPI